MEKTMIQTDSARVEQSLERFGFTKKEKKEFLTKLVTGDLEARNRYVSKMAQSGVAQHDIQSFLNDLAHLQKKGMYMTGEGKFKTGSGEITLQFRGGDNNLIIPVVIVIGIVIIAVAYFVFN